MASCERDDHRDYGVPAITGCYIPERESCASSSGRPRHVQRKNSRNRLSWAGQHDQPRHHRQDGGCHPVARAIAGQVEECGNRRTICVAVVASNVASDTAVPRGSSGCRGVTASLKWRRDATEQDESRDGHTPRVAVLVVHRNPSGDSFVPASGARWGTSGLLVDPDGWRFDPRCVEAHRMMRCNPDNAAAQSRATAERSCREQTRG